MSEDAEGAAELFRTLKVTTAESELLSAGGEGGEEEVYNESDDSDTYPVPEYPLHEAVSVQSSPMGGNGLFALRDFKAGDAIFEEKPFLSILNGVHWDWNDPEGSLAPESRGCQEVAAAVDALSEEDKKNFWEFTQAPVYGTEKIPLGVFWTNTIHIYSPDPDDEYDEKGRSCMFLMTCRLNHACKPNVEWGFDHSTDTVRSTYLDMTPPMFVSLAISRVCVSAC